MKKVLFSIMLLTSIVSYAQERMGVGTDTPKATLDVVGVPSNQNSMDGIIAPRITGDQLSAKTYTAEQKGAIVLVTAAATNLSGQTEKVDKEGYYYFDGQRWVTFSSGNVWNKAGTDKPAQANTDNMYVMGGNIGVGTKNPEAKLDVNGNVKLRNLADAKDDDTQVVVGVDGILRKSIYPTYRMNTLAGRFQNGASQYVIDSKRVGDIEFRLRINADQVNVEFRFADNSIPTQTCHVKGQRPASWTQNETITSSGWQEVFEFNYEVDMGGYANIIFEEGMCYRVDFHAWRYGSSGWVPYNVTVTELAPRQGNWK